MGDEEGEGEEEQSEVGGADLATTVVDDSSGETDDRHEEKEGYSEFQVGSPSAPNGVTGSPRSCISPLATGASEATRSSSPTTRERRIAGRVIPRAGNSVRCYRTNRASSAAKCGAGSSPPPLGRPRGYESDPPTLRARHPWRLPGPHRAGNLVRPPSSADHLGRESANRLPASTTCDAQYCGRRRI